MIDQLHLRACYYSKNVFKKRLKVLSHFVTTLVPEHFAFHVSKFLKLAITMTTFQRRNTSVYCKFTGDNPCQRVISIKLLCRCVIWRKKKQYRVYSRCSASQCNVNLHFTKERNCFREWHSVEFHRKY